MSAHVLQLTDEEWESIQQRVVRGDFRDESEVVRAALRLMDEQETSLPWPDEALARLAEERFREIENGDYIAVAAEDIPRFITEIQDEIDADKQQE